MHDAAFGWCARQVEARCREVPGKVEAVLDIGGRNINGTCRPLVVTDTYDVVDVREGPNVTYVADAADWRPPRTYEVVFCTEVLEHAARWREVVGTVGLAVESGGLAVVTCAGPGRAPHSAVDGEGLRPGEYYANVGAGELLCELGRWASACWAVESAGDTYAWAIR